MNPIVQHFAFIEGIGGPELMMIMFIVLLLFGGQKLPEFARGLGKSMREFKKAANGVEEEFRRAIEEEPAKPEPKVVATAAAPAAPVLPAAAPVVSTAPVPPATTPAAPQPPTPPPAAPSPDESPSRS